MALDPQFVKTTLESTHAHADEVSKHISDSLAAGKTPDASHLLNHLVSIKNSVSAAVDHVKANVDQDVSKAVVASESAYASVAKTVNAAVGTTLPVPAPAAPSKSKLTVLEKVLAGIVLVVVALIGAKLKGWL